MSEPTVALNPPRLVVELAERVATRGGRAYAVGGVVRDHLLGRPLYDWDIEVHRLPERELERILEGLGTVDAVGRAFSVFKLTRRGLTIDVALPRQDSNSGPGHRGIAVRGDPNLGPREACRRRDLTVNAILCDVLTSELVDPFGGAEDLRARRLRAVDADTFLEDPLRALRVVQFAARLHFTVDDSLLALCRRAPVDELPEERVREEWFKLLRAQHIAHGLDVARRSDLLDRVFPEAADAQTDAALDRQSPTDEPEEPRKMALMLLTWLADRDRSAVLATLDRLGLHRWLGYPVRDQLDKAHSALQEPADTDAALRHLAARAEPFLVLQTRAAVDPDGPHAEHLERATSLGLRYAAEPPLLLGRDLLAAGLKPGPAIGKTLARAYTAQLDGAVRRREEALAWLQRELAG